MTRAETRPIEFKVDKITEQLAEISILFRKSKKFDDYRSERSRDMCQGPAMICYIYKKPGHGANRCDMNPRRGQKCTHCGKIGHDVDNCWAKQG